MEYAGTGEPGSQGLFFFARHFLHKNKKCLVNLCYTAKEVPEKHGTHFLPGTCYEKMKSAWKNTEVKDLILPCTCSEKCLGGVGK